MGNRIPFCKKIRVALYRLIDIKQPEVKWALVTSVLLEVLLVQIKLYSNFSLYAADICSLLQDLIGSLVSLIGVAIAGVTIAITLFTREQVTIIEKVKTGAFETVLDDFKWLALLSTVNTAVFLGIILVIKSPYPLVEVHVFYLISFLLVYVFFYLLFYGYALIGNCIKLYRLKNTLEDITKQSKSVPLSALEFQTDFLVSKLLKNDKAEAKKFYSELISLVEKSNNEAKSEILEYLNNRYSAHTKME